MSVLVIVPTHLSMGGERGVYPGGAGGNLNPPLILPHDEDGSPEPAQDFNSKNQECLSRPGNTPT